MLDELLEEVQRNVRAALAEDIGSGDATARLIPPKKTGTAIIRTRQKAILCGTGWAQACFRQVNQDCNMHWLAADGDEIEAGSILCRIQGPLRDLLTAERTAINFLQTLSATSTRTRQYVDAIKGTPAQIYDTRKTLPGLRLA
ncbi:MAG: nicotinate-nucleotide diphosphorylase (carboxylating), partial [Pseudomonadota bacterium]|nr:nicotinate-nucleotide diphosphorylase (carboxylating) [Pseudomonadota bacterium]